MPAFHEIYTLQGIDLDLNQRKRRLAEIAEALGDRRKLDALSARLAELTPVTDALSSRQRALDDAIAHLTERIQQAETHLYSGAVLNPRELQGLQADIAQLGRQRDVQETGLLEVMEELDPLEALRTETVAELAEEQHAWDTRHASLLNEQAALRQEAAALTVRRNAQAATLPANELHLYEQVRSRNPQGKAAARLRNDMCDSCRVGLPRRLLQDLRTSAQLLRCPNCSLILIME